MAAGPDEVAREVTFRLLVRWIVVLLASLAAAWMLLLVLDGLRFRALGLWFYPRWWRDLGIGLAAGAGMISVVVVVLLAAGKLRLESAGLPAGDLFSGLFRNLLFVIVAAVAEEVLFRGYFFQKLVEGTGPGAALILLSVLFGLVHWDNPAANWLSTVNTVLMGALLAVAYLRTRALWVAIGLHIAWNFVMGAVYSLPVSGIPLPGRPLDYGLRGPDWLTGGAYGPEASMVTTAAALAAIFWLARTGRLRVSPEQRRELEWHPNEGTVS